MNSNEQPRTHGYFGLTVLALFAVAFIAGQARGDLDRAYLIDTSLPTAIELGVLLERAALSGGVTGREAIRKFRATPIVMDFGIDILAISERALSEREATSAGHGSGL